MVEFGIEVMSYLTSTYCFVDATGAQLFNGLLLYTLILISLVSVMCHHTQFFAVLFDHI